MVGFSDSLAFLFLIAELPDMNSVDIPYDALPDIEEDLKKEIIANNAEVGQRQKLHRSVWIFCINKI